MTLTFSDRRKLTNKKITLAEAGAQYPAFPTGDMMAPHLRWTLLRYSLSLTEAEDIISASQN